ncbi:efflux RND transporter periplasmic adaptor subunit [Novosphingobium sp.]|uniref:efflux RND transporter periplasmic adaptor subunit n=1 Tax=Novosphingobium sp. TaxID=1874826 RepID=UPI0025CC45F1|nr:efflux RND transporter periplasmic adaptor subunit [Novosphingobium sp.]
MNFDTRISSDDTALSDERNPLLGDADRRSRILVIAGIVAVLAVIVGVWFLTRSGGAGEGANAAKAQVPVVSVVSPGSGTIAGQINATGTLAARRALPVGIPGEGGQIVRVLVEPGQWVRQGQVLAIIDRSVQVQQQASQGAQVQVARANADLAEANYQRALKLVDKGFISKADVDRLRATRDGAYAQVRVAGAQLGVLRAQSARLNVVAPAAGLVLERRVEPGQVVSGGSGVLFSIAKGGEMELLAQVGEIDLAKLATGVSAEVTPVGSDRTFGGQIWQVAPVIDPQSRQGTARIALAYAPELRPGGFAGAVINAGSLVAPLLPESAILSDDKGRYVYVVDSANKVRRRAVKTGLVTGQGVAVIEGLNGAERVVLRAGGFLNPGDTVKPQAAKAN